MPDNTSPDASIGVGPDTNEGLKTPEVGSNSSVAPTTKWGITDEPLSGHLTGDESSEEAPKSPQENPTPEPQAGGDQAEATAPGIVLGHPYVEPSQPPAASGEAGDPVEKTDEKLTTDPSTAGGTIEGAGSGDSSEASSAVAPDASASPPIEASDPTPDSTVSAAPAETPAPEPVAGATPEVGGDQPGAMLGPDVAPPPVAKHEQSILEKIGSWFGRGPKPDAASTVPAQATPAEPTSAVTPPGESSGVVPPSGSPTQPQS